MGLPVAVKFDFPVQVMAAQMATKASGEEGLAARAVRRAARATVTRTQRNITAKGRVDNGRMRQSVTYKLISAENASVTAEVGIYVRYAQWQEEGTAGGGTGYIYPRTAKMLRFKPRGGAGFVFAKRVKGVKPGNFLSDAVKELGPADFNPGL